MGRASPPVCLAPSCPRVGLWSRVAVQCFKKKAEKQGSKIQTMARKFLDGQCHDICMLHGGPLLVRFARLLHSSPVTCAVHRRRSYVRLCCLSYFSNAWRQVARGRLSRARRIGWPPASLPATHARLTPASLEPGALIGRTARFCAIAIEHTHTHTRPLTPRHT